MNRLAILGCTGSIGTQTLDVVRSYPGEFSVAGLAAGYNIDLLVKQIEEFSPKMISSQRPREELVGHINEGCTIVSQEELASSPSVDTVLAAGVGSSGLTPILAAVRAGKTVLLVNKEPLVMAGELIMKEAELHHAQILPVDSEPSAIWQCLMGEGKGVSKVTITASGGALRGKSQDYLAGVTPEEALKHPTWSMGRKITIDSASLMNKGFEVIETRRLFNLEWEQIEVVIHHQSIIHGMVEFVDGSVKAQMSVPDMRIPIQTALFYPKRIPSYVSPSLNVAQVGQLTFEEFDVSRYPCFRLALQAGKKGLTYPAVLSAADEVAVEMFLNRSIGFTTIPDLIEWVLAKHDPVSDPGLEDILVADKWAREIAHTWPG